MTVTGEWNGTMEIIWSIGRWINWQGSISSSPECRNNKSWLEWIPHWLPIFPRSNAKETYITGTAITATIEPKVKWFESVIPTSIATCCNHFFFEHLNKHFKQRTPNCSIFSWWHFFFCRFPLTVITSTSTIFFCCVQFPIMFRLSSVPLSRSMAHSISLESTTISFFFRKK